MAGPAPNPRRGEYSRRRAIAVAAMLGTVASALAACGGDDSGGNTLTWYINPDSGGQEKIAARCTKESGGKYELETALLPEDASLQREQLIRRLAGNDDSVDIMSLDPPFVAEFASAGFLWDIPEADEKTLTEGVAQSAVESATYDGQLASIPFHINTQLLWYRKSAVQEAGINVDQPVTWEQIIQAAEQQNKTIGVQANRYEGYSVWINALIESAGGAIVENPDDPVDQYKLGIDSEAGTTAATIISQIAEKDLAGPAMSTMDEEVSRALFQGKTGMFLVNWPYVWPTWLGEVEAKTLDKSFMDDVGWTLYPRIDPSKPAEGPVGGINLGIGAFSDNPELAFEAAKCIVSEESQAFYFVDNGSPATLLSVYDDPEVKKAYPMAPDIQESIETAAPRTRTPYWNEISVGLQRTWHSPTSLDPESDPAAAQDLIQEVISGEALL